jgi:hypothetical protein
MRFLSGVIGAWVPSQPKGKHPSRGAVYLLGTLRPALIDLQLKYDANGVDRLLDGAFLYVSNDGLLCDE